MVKAILVLVVAVLFLTANATAQVAELFDDFGRIPCGDFMARMDAIWHRTKDLPASRVYVVYFGGRFRRRTLTKEREGQPITEAIQLIYPHRQDGLNFARSIPTYLSFYSPYGLDYHNSIKERVVLIDGGYMEKDSVEVWIGSERPTERPSPIDPRMIKFRADKPLATPKYFRCYEHY